MWSQLGDENAPLIYWKTGVGQNLSGYSSEKTEKTRSIRKPYNLSGSFAVGQAVVITMPQRNYSITVENG